MVGESPTEIRIGKLEKKLDETFVSDVKAMSPAALKESALKYAKEIERVEEEKDSDEKLQSLRDSVKDLGKAYSDAKKHARLRMQYVLATMKLNGAE
jgi:hypothetical protein